jgi:glycosyltransferase involved in cell wall biosynthesis
MISTKNYTLDVHVIANGVDMSKWELSPPILNMPVTIAYVGRLSYVKGVEDYLNVIESIKTTEDAESLGAWRSTVVWRLDHPHIPDHEPKSAI